MFCYGCNPKFRSICIDDAAVLPIFEAKRTSREALDTVEIASCDSLIMTADCDHISLNVTKTARNDIEDMQIYVGYCSCFLHSVLFFSCFCCRSQVPADQGLLGGMLVSESHQIMNRIPKQRVVAKTIETAYVYDFM
jgi:hypothetical protein